MMNIESEGSTSASRHVEFDQPIALTSSNLSVNALQGLFVARTLKLRPAFQRNLVWNPEQQSFLIDTVLRGLPVPEVYVQKATSDDGTDEHTVVVDGQQRITALLKFLNGRLVLIGDDELGPRWKGKRFAELDNELKRRFRTFELVARQLPNLDEAVLREVFRRLNKTVESLEPQELRHAAYSGPLIGLLEKAAAQQTLEEIGVFSPKDYLRRRNDEFLAEVAFAYTAGAFPNKKDGLDEFFLIREKQGVKPEEISDITQRLGRAFAELSASPAAIRRTRFRNKSDFYSLIIYLLKNAEHLPLSGEVRSQFERALLSFGSRVNEIKRKESEGDSDSITDEFGLQARKYLRAVERAASDRLSRVRRDEALAAVLDPIFSDAPKKALSAADAEWTAVESEPADPADEILGPEALAAEREKVQRVLMESKSDFDDLLDVAHDSDDGGGAP